MITERDNIKAKASIEMIEASTLEPQTKAELKESVEETKANLNGRTLEERVLSIAQSQFDQTRLLAGIIIQFKKVADKIEHPEHPEQAEQAEKLIDTKGRSWKDTIVETQWGWVVLGSVIAICTIFQPQIVSLMKTVALHLL